MSGTRYCSTCGSLLSEGAAICGECGARYQASPYERRATDAPGAWSQAPTPRRRDRGAAEEEAAEDDGIEIISRESLRTPPPGATALRTAHQYDQRMVTPPPMQQSGPGSAPGMMSGPGSPASALAPQAPAAGAPMEQPLDGCTPAAPLKRFLAAVIDAVIGTLVTVPLAIGLALVLTAETVGPLPLILIGVGTALPVAYVLLIIWLVGAKGFSLGKLILGLRVADTAKGGRLGFLRSLGRWLIYGLIPLVMALSIFIDPKKRLRGFHDRAIGSVVVDVNVGRNPLVPRTDDFERADPEHYLGRSSVAVSAHENLLAEPGAAWRSEPASAQPPTSGAWGGDQQSAAGAYAPPVAPAHDAAPAEAADPWAPPAVDPVPAPQPAWGQSPSQPARDQSVPQPGWDRPAAHTQPWDQPAPSQPLSFDQPVAPPQSWDQPAPHQPARPEPAPRSVPEPSGAPSDLTEDAWPDSAGIDEQTRMSLPEDPAADLEQTRISPLRLPAVRTLRLVTDDGAERVVERAVVVGRNPAAPGDELVFVLKDETRSVSKTHLLIDGTGDEVLVTDLGSTNGSTILHQDGSRDHLVPSTPTVLPSGAQVTLGDRTLTVEREQ
ncbi:RDD family protein [Brachybacterium sp. UNK5269]|uniref:RDD family protein n=1 Tax=Brachybacterium sp. UNK5269 TaxID=3408576 RepID=UPI003BB0206B